MKKFKVTFVLNGRHMETVIEAPSWGQAVALTKAQYPNAYGVNAQEIR